MNPEFKSEGKIKGVIKIYSRMCLDTFIRGVGSPLSQFMRNYRPTSLAQAYQYALEFQNTEYRTNLNIPSSIPQVMPTFGNPQMFPQQYRQNFMPRQQVNQPRYSNPCQNYTGPPARQNYAAPARQDYAAPEPMEVDRSIRSKNVNYQKGQFNNNDQRKGLTRQSQETPSWRVQAPEQKRINHLAHVEEDEATANFNLADEATRHTIEQKMEIFMRHQKKQIKHRVEFIFANNPN